MRKPGFTVIELLVVVVFLLASGVVLFFQLQRASTENDNNQKKVAINALYYSLEESFYPENKYYPANIEKGTLKTLDSELLKDPDGISLGEEGSSYRYEPKNCKEDKCASYTLRASLHKEEDFVKNSKNK